MLALKLNKKRMIINLSALFIILAAVVFVVYRNFFSAPNVPSPDNFPGAVFGPGVDASVPASSKRINIESVKSLGAETAVLKDKRFRNLKDNSVIIDISNVERGKNNPFEPNDAAGEAEE